MKNIIVLLSALVFPLSTNAQVINTGIMDTSSYSFDGKVTIGGYIDTYYGYDFNKPPLGDRPYFVSSARHNEFTINLAYLDVKYSSSRLRARFVPGFGTYMNANYAAEPGVLKNIVEGSIGIRLFKNRSIWLDVGVMGSPYTNESAISRDHLMYTRSFAPEYVPYYVTGLKLTMPVNATMNVYLYILNGWQQIQDQNKNKSIGTQLEYRPGEHWLVNWNTYIGNEYSASAPQNGMRYFSDIYFIYNNGRISATGCIYGGIQQRDYVGQTSNDTWWQANLIGKYAFTGKVSLSGRVEYFDDLKSVQITPITSADGFSSYSTALCLNLQLADNIVARFEGRAFFSDREVYLRDDNPVKNSNLLISNLTIWF